MDFGDVSVSPTVVRREVIGGIDMKGGLGETPEGGNCLTTVKRMIFSRTCPERSV